MNAHQGFRLAPIICAYRGGLVEVGGTQNDVFAAQIQGTASISPVVTVFGGFYLCTLKKHLLEPRLTDGSFQLNCLLDQFNVMKTNAQQSNELFIRNYSLH